MRFDRPQPFIEALKLPSPEAAVWHPPTPATVQLARDHANAALHAVMSYSSENGIRRGRPREEVEYFTYSADELAAFAEMDGDNAVIAFRGTLKEKLANWKVDFNFMPRGNPLRHRGFLGGWESLRTDISRWLEERQPKAIVLAGHSLGGAMALLAAFDLAEKWQIAGVTVFGCPRVGTPGFASMYDAHPAGPGATKKLGEITTRYVKATDVFSRMPPPFGFAHVGKSIYISEQGNRITSPMPFAARVYQNTLPGAQPDDPSPASAEGAILTFARSLGVFAGAAALPLWGTVAVFTLVSGLAFRRDVAMHDSDVYRTALANRRLLIERQPGLAHLI